MTMAEAGGVVTTRTRKLFFDEYTGGFYFESKVESLERTCRQRQEKNETCNKGRELITSSKHKQVEKARSLFTGKFLREMNTLRRSLQDMVAYRRVLKELAMLKAADRDADSIYGKYGLLPEPEEIQPMMEAQKTRMSPAYRRRKEAEALLAQRRPMIIMDRKKPTPELLRSWRDEANKPNPNRVVKRPLEARLSLPPIAAMKYHRRNSRGAMVTPPPRTPRSVCKPEKLQQVVEDDADPDNPGTPLPAIFVTQTTQSKGNVGKTQTPTPEVS